MSELLASGGHTRANDCSVIHYNARLAERHPSRPDVLRWSRREFATLKTVQGRLSEAAAAAGLPALQAGGAEIKMEWIGDDGSRRPDVLVLWLLASVNQDGVVLHHLSEPSVSFCESPLSRGCRRRTHYFSIDVLCVVKARAAASILMSHPSFKIFIGAAYVFVRLIPEKKAHNLKSAFIYACFITTDSFSRHNFMGKYWFHPPPNIFVKSHQYF